MCLYPASSFHHRRCTSRCKHHSSLKKLDRIITKKKKDGTEKKIRRSLTPKSSTRQEREKESEIKSAICLLILQLPLLKKHNVLV
jgi:hypothetical protein